MLFERLEPSCPLGYRIELTRTRHTFTSTTTGIVVGFPDLSTISCSLPLSTTNLGWILSENSREKSLLSDLRIISLQASAASPPNSEISDIEPLAMLPRDFSDVAFLPESNAISEMKGGGFTPLNSISIEGSGTSIPCQAFLLSHEGHARSGKFEKSLQQQLRAIRKFFQDLIAVTLWGLDSHSLISSIGNGPSIIIPSMEILLSGSTSRVQSGREYWPLGT